MMKKILPALFALCFCFTLCGCFFEAPRDYFYEADLQDTEYVKTLTSESSITLTGVKEKTILYANFNTSATDTVDFPRVLTYASSVDTSGTFVTPSYYSVPSRSLADNERVQESQGIKQIKHFIPPKTFTLNADASRSLMQSDIAPVLNKAANLEVGSTKNFYADTNLYLDNYQEKTFCLAAEGKSADEKTVCLVWVDQSLYLRDGQCRGETINFSLAENLGERFAAFYQKERDVFGAEYEYLLDRNYYPNGKIEDLSDTGNVVNIVIYDIGNDFIESAQRVNTVNSNNDECMVVGYFYAKDYFVPGSNYNDVRNYSNGGKFFYIDASFCNYSGNDGTQRFYNGNLNSQNQNIASDTVISTLFHEFQHMIDFGQKNVNGVSVPVWYNEMLSMLAEDMMQNALGLSDAEAPKGARLPTFNKYYYLSGIDEILDGQDAAYSYSTAYSFGAWLSREFGGPQFVSRMSKNAYGGMDSVKAAVKELTGQSYSSLQLFKLYMQACAFRPSFASQASHTLPTHYKDGGGAMQDFSMNKINLAAKKYGFTVGGQKFYGPAIFKSDAKVAVRPHGFVLHSVGRATSDTVTLQFSAPRDSNEQIVIFIQDKFSNTEPDSCRNRK